MKFLVDQMLGTLAKWLRLCGIDTFYANQEISDDVLLEIAEKEHRILITRDKELFQRTQKKHIESMFTDAIDLSEQINLMFNSFPEALKQITPLSRCSLCNHKVTEISKENIKENVPERIFHEHDQFWKCSHCHQIYWKGSHYEKILTKINEIKKNQEKNLHKN
mgnify:FL=1